MGVKPEDIERAIAEGNKVLAQLKKECPSTMVEYLLPETKPSPKPKKRIRQSSDPKMNKLETEALSMLKSTGFGHYVIRPKSMKLQLANGCWYTPDLVGHRDSTLQIAWEVKGPHAWDDSIVKLKVAAREWPAIQFVLLWKENGQWKNQPILP